MSKEYHLVSASATATKNSDHFPVVVVMVPLPAQGHLNQLLHLSHLLSTFNIPIHFAGAATHNRQAKLRHIGGGADKTTHACETSNLHLSKPTPIQFHDFDIPTFPSPPPDPAAPTKFPSQLIPTITAASLHLRGPLTTFLHSLARNAKRLVVIHDSLMSSAVQGVDGIPNAESYCFHSVSVFAVALHCMERNGKRGALYEEYFPKEMNVPPLEGCFPAEFLEFIDSEYGQLPESESGKIYNSCRVIEGRFLEAIQRLEHQLPHWALGPFNPVQISPSLQSSSNHSCLAWLDQQEPRSVIYISFGTTIAMEDEQIKEIAIGLARSRQKFIWVLRDADTSDVFRGSKTRKMELPKGYETMIGEIGLVIREWAPQVKILSHRATGGFMTHCGWNSCIESMTAGVPVAAWPMHSDQPRNTVLMTTVLRVGVVVREWGRGSGEVVEAAAVEQAVRKLMVSKEGAEIRRNAERLGEAIRQSVHDNGESRRELEAFVAHIKR